MTLSLPNSTHELITTIRFKLVIYHLTSSLHPEIVNVVVASTVKTYATFLA